MTNQQWYEMLKSSTFAWYTLLPSQIESAILQFIEESMYESSNNILHAIYDIDFVLLLSLALQQKGDLNFIRQQNNHEIAILDNS